MWSPFSYSTGTSPFDWLLDHILWVKVCNPEKNAKLWDPHKVYLRVCFNLSLFQFVGTQYLLAGEQDPESEGQGLGEAGIAGRALQHAGGGEREPPDLAALPHGAGVPALAFFLRSKVRCRGLPLLPPLLAVRSGEVLVPEQFLFRSRSNSDHLAASSSAPLWKCCPLITSSRTREIGMRDAQPHSGALGSLMATTTLVPSTVCGRGRGGGWPLAPGSTAPLHPDRLTNVGHSDWHLP